MSYLNSDRLSCIFNKPSSPPEKMTLWFHASNAVIQASYSWHLPLYHVFSILLSDMLNIDTAPLELLTAISSPRFGAFRREFQSTDSAKISLSLFWSELVVSIWMLVNNSSRGLFSLSQRLYTESIPTRQNYQYQGCDRRGGGVVTLYLVPSPYKSYLWHPQPPIWE